MCFGRRRPISEGRAFGSIIAGGWNRVLEGWSSLDDVVVLWRALEAKHCWCAKFGVVWCVHDDFTMSELEG